MPWLNRDDSPVSQFSSMLAASTHERCGGFEMRCVSSTAMYSEYAPFERRQIQRPRQSFNGLECTYSRCEPKDLVVKLPLSHLGAHFGDMSRELDAKNCRRALRYGVPAAALHNVHTIEAESLDLPIRCVEQAYVRRSVYRP